MQYSVRLLYCHVWHHMAGDSHLLGHIGDYGLGSGLEDELLPYEGRNCVYSGVLHTGLHGDISILWKPRLLYQHSKWLLQPNLLPVQDVMSHNEYRYALKTRTHTEKDAFTSRRK